MDKRSTPEQLLIDELQISGTFPARYQKILLDFIASYRKAIEQGGLSFQAQIPILRQFIQLTMEQLQSPHTFEPYHQKIKFPFDYAQFGIDFILPLVDLSTSHVLGQDNLDRICTQLSIGENAVFLANHQIEPDPQAIAILLKQSHPRLSDEIIYVAGERVISDPLAMPFSLGTNLLCIYSKRYIDQPPELKAQKLQHNKQTMEKMSRLLQEGGKAIYVAPAGGRDRPDAKGKLEPAPFDPHSIELFYLMAKKAKTPTHFYPLALSTYNLLPPPETIQQQLGETRTAKRSPIHLFVGAEFDMDHYIGSDAADKDSRRQARAQAIWSTVKTMYDKLKK